MRFIIFIMTLSALIATAHAESQQKQHSKLKRQINNTESSLHNARIASEKLHKNVLSAEKELDQVSRQLYQTEKKINKLATKLTKSNALRKKLLEQTESQKSALAQQMQALYTAGKQSHLRLLLKQDDPSDISRTVKYFEYLNLHRLKRIRRINHQLEKIHIVQEQISLDRQQLSALQKDQAKKKKALKVAVAKREKIFKKQRKTVYTQEQKLKKLKREESRLVGVIAALEAKRVRAEKARKREQAERKQREKAEKTLAKKKGGKAAKKTASTQLTKPHYVPNKAFSSLKGRLAWPVRGRIAQRYGSIRNSKQRWKGVIISAPGGSKVHAVARGTVEFSGRLNGYGYLIIIRHDKNYRSLYAYNRSVYKREGQIVKAGEVIAAVGNSGGRSQNGLYFEIRKGTAHRNPASWCH